MAQSLAYLYSERTRILQDIANVQQQIAYAQQNANAAILAGLQTRLASDQEYLAAINCVYCDPKSKTTMFSSMFSCHSPL